MKHVAITLVCLLSSPALAQDESSSEAGRSLMERGAQLFFEGLMKEVEPALKDLEDFAQELEPALQEFITEMGPALRDLAEKVEDWSLYEAPEILPNGDIIIRRKPAERTGPDPEAEIEL